MTGKIFISYRRSDSDAVAHRMFDWLVEQFGPDAVFIDIDRIPAGADWRSDIAVQVRAASVVLVVIAETWLEALHARADDPKDVLRLEIETALAEGRPVIPVLIERTDMPGYGQLPVWAARLPDFNAARVSKTADFKPHMERLGTRLAEGFGFKRVVAAGGAVTKARPATADLVVPSTYRGPPVPPPKMGETWEKIENPRLAEFGGSHAAWVPAGLDGEYDLIVACMPNIGRFQVSRPDSKIERLFGRWEAFIHSPRYHQFAPNGSRIIFSTYSVLYKWDNNYRSILAEFPSAGYTYPETHIISELSSSNRWLHVYRRYDPSAGEWPEVVDVYSGDDIMVSIRDRWLLDQACGQFSWSPSGVFGLINDPRPGWAYGGSWLCRVDPDCDSKRSWRKLVCGESLSLPDKCNGMSGSASWHPRKDLFAFSTYANPSNNVILDCRLAIADASSMTTVFSRPLNGNIEWVETAWSSTGRFVAAKGSCVTIWDLWSDEVRQLFAHDRKVESISFSPDGARLLTTGNGQCVVWDPASGERIASWQGWGSKSIRPSPWSPSGATLVTGNNGIEIRRLAI